MERRSATLWGLGSIILVCAYPCVFQYAHNIQDALWLDALLFFGIFLATAAVIFLAALAVLRNVGRAALICDLTMLVVMNFGLVDSALKARFSWARALLLGGLVGLLLLGLLILLLRKKWNCKVPCLLLCLMFGGMTLVSLGSTVPHWLQHALSPEPALEAPPAAAEGPRPNVYFFLYDEYGGPDNLDFYYDYDDGAFYEALDALGFVHSDSSYNMESTNTAEIVPNLYALQYLDTYGFQSGDGEVPALYQLFQDMGYRIQLINHNSFLDTDKTEVLSHDQYAESICKYLFQNSLFSIHPLNTPFLKLPQLQYTYAYVTMLMDVFRRTETAWETAQDSPTLTLGYIQCPHIGFVVDRDGNYLPGYAWSDWRDPQYYLGQLEYTNRRILSAVQAIRAHDPEAVIILQSDHGARLSKHRQDLYNIPYQEADLIHEHNILNAVCLPGQELSIEGLSGINTLRTVLNTVYGTDYEMLTWKES